MSQPEIVPMASQIDWRAVAQFVTAGVLFLGLIYTALQVRLLRRTRDTEDRITISQRTIDHNSLVLKDDGTRAAVALLENLHVPNDKPDSDLYWAVRGVHLSHINLIWQVWQLAGSPGAGEDLKNGNEGWQRFAREIVANKLRAAHKDRDSESATPADKAGGDLWEGLSKYEVVPPRFVAWLDSLSPRA